MLACLLGSIYAGVLGMTGLAAGFDALAREWDEPSGESYLMETVGDFLGNPLVLAAGLVPALLAYALARSRQAIEVVGASHLSSVGGSG